MPKELEVGDFYAGAVLAIVEIVDHLIGFVEPDQFHFEGIAHAVDVANQIIILLLRSGEISWPVDQPSNFGTGIFLLDLFDPNPRSPDEIHPPIIVRLSLPLFPNPEGNTTSEDDVFLARRGGRCLSRTKGGERDEDSHEEEEWNSEHGG